MEIAQHPSNNFLLSAPPGMDGCADLPCTMGPDADNNVILTSYWRPTPEELQLLNQRGYVQLTVWGRMHPPVMLGVSL